MAAQASESKRVKLNTGMVGNTLDEKGRVVSQFARVKGDVIEMPAKEADAYCAAGYASPVPSK